MSNRGYRCVAAGSSERFLSPTESLRLLRSARVKVASSQRFVRGQYALDVNGDPVQAISPDAVSWCPGGALIAAAAELGSESEIFQQTKGVLDDHARRTTNGRCQFVENLADLRHCTVQRVLAVYDRAIESFRVVELADRLASAPSLTEVTS